MKIVILDAASLGEDTPLSHLRRLGEVVIYKSTSRDELAERVADAEVIIVNKIKVDRELLSMAPRLRLICVFATGYDNIDVLRASEMGIGVCNVPAYSTESVTLFTMATTLSLAAHLREYGDFVKSGEYFALGLANRLTPVYHNVSGLTWGIVGYGNIGRAVGRVAEALGARVIVNKRTPTDGAETVDIDTLCKTSDIITLHCPLNDESRSLIDERRIAMMKPSVILVNEARGAVVDEEAVAAAIEEGRIAAFGSDVYTSEPFGKDHPFERIKMRNNVILTPHAAWGSYEARAKCIDIICENIEAFVDGKIKNRVDK